MPSADSFRALARAKRAIPGQFGIRPHRVYLVVETWSGPTVGDGIKDTTETEIVEGDSQPPKVRQLSGEERALGNLSSGSLEIGPITPPSTGTITADMLHGVDLEPGTDTLKLRVVGPLGDAQYAIKEKRMDRALRWMIVAEPLQMTAE